MLPSLQFHHRRLSAGICLLVLVTSLSWVRAAVVYLVAQADASHTAGLLVRDTGLTVVLRHEGAALPALSICALHRHGITARVLTLFADGPSARQDHVVTVGGGPDPLTLASQPTGQRHASAQPSKLVPCVVRWCSPLDRQGPSVAPRPPPVPDARLALVRVTVLLV